MTDAPVAKVWIAETGDYEQRGIVGVYSSVETAVQQIKETYQPPYVVRWDDVSYETPEMAHLIGHFEDVQGYSVRHTGVFEITEWAVDGQ